MSKSKHSSIQPKSIRQKQILDIAAKNPSATLGEIADEVPSASTDHVDRVLDQYGDPAADDDEETTNSSEEGDAAHVTNDDVASNGHAMSEPDSQKEGATENEVTGGSAGPDDTDEAGDTEKTDKTGDPAVIERSDESTPTNETDDTAATEHAEQTDDADVSEPPVGSETTGRVINDDEPVGDADDTEPTAEETLPDLDDLTQKERETLRAIYYEPKATQKAISDMLSVSRATVSNRVNAIPGFDWAERQSFVDTVFDGDLVVNAHDSPSSKDNTEDIQNETQQVASNGGAKTVGGTSGVLESRETPDDGENETDSMTPNSGSSAPVTTGVDETGSPSEQEEATHDIEEISQRLATIEKEMDRMRDTGDTEDECPFDDAELVQKVLYACMNSERISEEEELEILQEFMS